MKAENIEVDITANTEELENALDDVKEATDRFNRPNIVIRNKGDVYLTVNYWSEDSGVKNESKSD